MRIYKKNRITGEVTPVRSAYDGCRDGSTGAEVHRLNRMCSDTEYEYVQLTREEAEHYRETFREKERDALEMEAEMRESR